MLQVVLVFFSFVFVKPPSFLFLGCAVLPVSPVVETPTYWEGIKEVCDCDFDEFVILGKIWTLGACDWGPPSCPHTYTY